MCRLISFTKSGTFLVIIYSFKYSFFTIHSFLSLWYSNYAYICIIDGTAQVSYALFTLFHSFFLLFTWIISNDLSFNSSVLSSACSNLLSQAATLNFSFQILYLSAPKFLLDSFCLSLYLYFLFGEI